MLIFTRSLKPRIDVDFATIGNAISSDTLKFRISNLKSGSTFQWYIKASKTDADIDAIAGDFGPITASTLSIHIPLPAIDYTVGNTYYFALREFDGGDSQEVIQVSFTISQNAVLGQGVSILNIHPLYLPEFSTVDRDLLTVNRSVIIYNITNQRIEKFDPVTETWGPLEGGSGGSAVWGDISGTLSSQIDLQNELNLKANTASLAIVATTGIYNDLTGSPTIPSATSQLTNDSGFITTNAVTSVNAQTGAVTLAKGDIGLSNVDNTSDTDKPISTATQTALNAKENTLVSGTTIKTINGTSLLGAGNIEVSGGGGGGAVDSVNGMTGTVVLNADNIDDTATLHKFVTAGDVTKLSTLSGTNTGDQDISNFETTTQLNTRDTANRNRDNHTGTQAIATVTNLQTTLDNKQPIATVLTNTTASFTTAQETKLAGIETGAQVNTVTSVASKTGAVTLVKDDVGLANVANVDTTTTANITDSSNKRFVTDAQQTVITNTSGINTGDQNISNFETTTQLNTRDTNNRARDNHTGTQLANTISDFQATVSANSNVTENTAKVTNATHTGDVTGATELTLSSTAITGKTTVTPVSGDFVLVSDASDSGNLKKVDASNFLGGGGGGGATIMQTGALSSCASADTAPVQQYSHLVTCPSAMTVTKMTVYIATLDGSPTVELGIYTEGGTRLGTKTGTPSAIGFFTLTLDTGIALTGGTRYYLSLLNQTSPNTTTFLRDTGRSDAILNRLQGSTSSMPDPLAAGSGTGRSVWILASVN